MLNRIRGFKPWFNIIVALVGGGLGLYLGVAIRSYFVTHRSTPAALDSFRTIYGSHPFYMSALIGGLTAIGILVGMIVGQHLSQRLEEAGNTLEGMSAADKIAVFIGAVIGVLISLVFIIILSRAGMPGVLVSILLSIAFIYLSVRASMGMRNDFPWLAGKKEVVAEEQRSTTNCKILDTNVIIDGRIADVCRSGFLEGTIYVPGFVLEELQHIADSADSLKRARGRRGLDILKTMQNELSLVVRVWDKSLEKSSHYEEVDSKLVKLAKALEGVIVTNDYNLNKVAILQNVQVLNVNELANALKPMFLPGEAMRVMVVKEGKDADQGVAYLDDGTMIVVEDGRQFLGQTMLVVVTSVLQTAAGKMIFARIRGEEDMLDDNREQIPQHSGGYAAGSARRGDTPRSRAGKKVQ